MRHASVGLLALGLALGPVVQCGGGRHTPPAPSCTVGALYGHNGQWWSRDIRCSGGPGSVVIEFDCGPIHTVKVEAFAATGAWRASCYGSAVKSVTATV